MVEEYIYGRVGRGEEKDDPSTILGCLESMVSLLHRPSKDAYSSVWTSNLDRLAAVVLRSPDQGIPKEELAEIREFLQTCNEKKVRKPLVKRLKQYRLVGESPSNQPLREKRIKALFGGLARRQK